MAPTSLLGQLKARKLFHWLAAYLAGAWLFVQALDVLSDAFHWPDGVQQGGIALAAVGLLVALVIAWYHGERGSQRISGMEIHMLAGILVIAGFAALSLMTAGIIRTIMFSTSFTLSVELIVLVTAWKMSRYSLSRETVFSKCRAFMIPIAACSAIALIFAASVLLPRLIERVQSDVGEQRRDDCSHAIANFEFERSVGRPRRRNLP